MSKSDTRSPDTAAVSAVAAQSPDMAAIDALVAEAVAAAKPSLFVTFEAKPDGSEAKRLARATVTGCFGSLRHVALTGFDLALDARQNLIVYMPGYGQARYVVPEQTAYASPVRDARGRLITHGASDAALADLDMLTQAIISAWGDAGASGERFNRPIRLGV